MDFISAYDDLYHLTIINDNPPFVVKDKKLSKEKEKILESLESKKRNEKIL